MENVNELISRVSQELGADASDEEIRDKVLEVIEALPASDRARMLEQLVKGVSAGQLRHLNKEVEDGRGIGGTGMPDTEPSP